MRRSWEARGDNHGVTVRPDQVRCSVLACQRHNRDGFRGVGLQRRIIFTAYIVDEFRAKELCAGLVTRGTSILVGFAQWTNNTSSIYSFKSDDAAYDGASLIVCTDSLLFRNLCWWKSPALIQKRSVLRFSHNDYDFSDAGYINYNWTHLNDAPQGTASEWKPMGFKLDRSSNVALAEFGRYQDLVEGEPVRIDTHGRVVINWVNEETGGNLVLSNWYMCEVEGRNRRTVLHWAYRPSVLDESCVKVDVVRVDAAGMDVD